MTSHRIVAPPEKTQYQLKETINHPTHYTSHPAGVECIDIIRWFPYNIGAVIKHLWRAGLKTDDRLEDPQKALAYLQNEIEREQIRKADDD